MTQRVILAHDIARERCEAAVRVAPENYWVEIRPPKRTDAQNRLMWALLDDLSEQVEWYGKKLTSKQWKHVMSAGLEGQEAVPSISGDGFVVMGKDTSDMTKKEFAELCELIFAFGADHGVTWSNIKIES